jgi:hypothetical protein
VYACRVGVRPGNLHPCMCHAPTSLFSGEMCGSWILVSFSSRKAGSLFIRGSADIVASSRHDSEGHELLLVGAASSRLLPVRIGDGVQGLVHDGSDGCFVDLRYIPPDQIGQGPGLCHRGARQAVGDR